jgi:L-threonylcarbamoyladenylate synthase
MQTLHLTNSEQDIERAAAVLKDGGLVAMPTETVYGLAANALDGNAVRRIFEAKGRPMDNPLIVHVAHVADIARLGLAADFPITAQRLAKTFWPGPLTIILPKGKVIPDEVSAGLDTVAIRIPSHPDARRLIERSGLALAAPSANTSGKPSPTTAQHVIDDMDGKIEAVLDGGACEVGVESTVITLATDIPRILRPGLITPDDIRAVIGRVEVDKAVLHQLEKNERASSPGMKYKHYAPRAKVILLRGSEEKCIAYVDRAARRGGKVAAMCYDEEKKRYTVPTVSLGSRSDEKDQAKRLFAALREVDGMDPHTTVYAPCPKADGVGLALYNRLIRAAAFEVIDLPEKRIIGLTGQTGAGKSEVAEMFREMGLPVVSADLAARKAVDDADVKAALCTAFGDVLNPDGSLDRRKVASIAFGSVEKLARLNRITHPRIVEIMLDEANRSAGEIVIFDAPQLFEAEVDPYCDHIISVLSDREKRMERLMERDGLTRQEIALRMNVQYGEDFFTAYSDSVIRNNGTMEELRAQVKHVYERLVGDGE